MFAAVGRHPNSADGFDQAAAEAIEELCAMPGGRGGRRDRARLLSRPVRAGGAAARLLRSDRDRRLGPAKPLVIHLRDADGSEDAVSEAFETLDARGATASPSILHCFSAGAPWAERAAERGWYCSFAGNLTYPKAEAIREAAAVVPEERLLVETDSPFLAPQPVRGKPNQPANVVATAERLAEVRGVPYGELERTVEANAARVFGW